MRYAHQQHKISRDVANILSSNRKVALSLLDEEEPFGFSDFPAIEKRLWYRFADYGVIKKADEYTNFKRVWLLNPLARERLEEYQESANQYSEGTKVCPYCGNYGFKNLPGADYQCSHPGCEREFETFAEVGRA